MVHCVVFLHFIITGIIVASSMVETAKTVILTVVVVSNISTLANSGLSV